MWDSEYYDEAVCNISFINRWIDKSCECRDKALSI